jgi:pyruvate,water dikinase
VPQQSRPSEKLLAALRERAKELNCLYAVEEVLHRVSEPLPDVVRDLLSAIPPGWQWSEVCQARIEIEGAIFRSDDFVDTPWSLRADIAVHRQPIGAVQVCYLQEMPPADVGPFLKEEVRLLHAVADRIAIYLQRRGLERATGAPRPTAAPQTRRGEWRGAIHLLRKTDQNLYMRIARKMMNLLCWSGMDEAQRAMRRAGEQPEAEDLLEGNWPQQKQRVDNRFFLSDEPFEIASSYLSDEEILNRIERWTFEDRSSFLVKTLASPQSSLGQIAEAIRRFRHILPEDAELSRSLLSGMRVSLIRRFLTEQLEFIKVAKEYIDVGDFLQLLDRMVLPAESHGKLGGKSAGLFLATQVLKRTVAAVDGGADWRVPRSWYIASDGILDFIAYNNMEDVIEHKYKEIDQIRREYPHLVQLFKNAAFPPELVQGLSMALDDFGDQPLIVRSSSLLEDRLGTAFSGKYKSLFLANQGTKRRRLEALMDAIAEIYASTFGPDPIEYRRERNLLDFNEEMGILLQEVVGRRLGRYFLPAFSGVAFSNNEFRWSPRIKRDDGLLRLVPGLGTRAVDRVPDDYPVLIAPGQPNLRANVSVEDVLRYSPKKVDLINLETEHFETHELRELLAEYGCDYPGFTRVFSVVQDNCLRKPVGLLCDASPDELCVTFDGLAQDTPFVERMARLLKTLQQSLGTPVDVEFASDGVDVYLLQCRPQSYSASSVSVPIPTDVPPESVVFSANRYVSNGFVPDITHIVYVDPERYGALRELSELVAVGRAVGRLNKLLPKRQFILIGPGRWGSRGDIKLGVNVTYSDINNTAVLIEVARKKGNYLPDLSFGTHFFQDLVEASIRYLPLYPDDEGVLFNEAFLRTASNLLPDMLPEYAALGDTLRVIDVPRSTRGQVLRVAMNAELDQALGYLGSPAARGEWRADRRIEREPEPKRQSDDHWRWRQEMAEHMGQALEPARFGVEALYLFGSAKNANAGPASDIDLLIHFRGSEEQRGALLLWLEGWNACLGEINYLRTGVRPTRMVDPHLVTDQDIAAHRGFASKIDAVTDAAKPLPLGRAAQQPS